jgi:hypothetical protein
MAIARHTLLGDDLCRSEVLTGGILSDYNTGKDGEAAAVVVELADTYV